ncbi:MAG TPA: helix-turn-helix transcriptional regulator [Dehalococcoidia bacterium]|jgi:transcriptional regulator with XRE-family HTH domain|nr:hypothetical protein [Chloroflexota bacterium]MDP5877200.1 helix-turn-helix transcriptional regulator [Dehalococcoidia bacterium]HJM53239.1 helix-turn-helix transcriptional regulator [Dehalococcoidia bacterium]|tara:strand:+ start:1500 stop:1916 length:417 start_codon:yes stop_codon:yes gene_type:complete
MALTDKDIGRNVRYLRVERKLTQAALANRVYLDRTAISRLERGERTVTAPELASIAQALGVGMELLTTTHEQRAAATRASYEPPKPVTASPSHWMQIHLGGGQAGYLVGPGTGRVPAIALADTSEAPVTKVVARRSTD